MRPLTRWFGVAILLTMGAFACERPGPPVVVTVVVVAPTATATPEPTPAPVPTPTPIPPTPSPLPIVRATPTLEPEPPPPTPTPTPELPICAMLPIRGFGQVWFQSPTMRELLGCPIESRERLMERYGAQRFEGGVMLWVSQRDFPWESGVVLALFRDNMTFARFTDTWREGEPEPPAPTPPEGRFAPAGQLGKVWREGAGVRTRLGWALEPEKKGGSWLPDPQRAINGAAQGFGLGVMYWIPYGSGTPQYLEDRWIYALATKYPPPADRPGLPWPPRNDWAEFLDTWRE